MTQPAEAEFDGVYVQWYSGKQAIRIETPILGGFNDPDTIYLTREQIKAIAEWAATLE